MAYETIELNLIPSGTVPLIHAAQYDKERPLIFKLMLGDDDFNPSGYDLELQVRKVDNNIVTVSDCTVSGNIVTFLTSEQMTACSGSNLGEIQISKDDFTIATLHFYLVVQRDVLVGGITSQSFIHDLEEQIEELLPSALGNEYYTKDQTDTLLEGKADISDIPDMSDYYKKSETYSSNEVNTLLSGKADINDLGIWLNGILLSGSTTLTLSSDKITNNSIIDVYCDVFGVSPTNIVVTSGQIVLTFDAQNININIKVRVI